MADKKTTNPFEGLRDAARAGMEASFVGCPPEVLELAWEVHGPKWMLIAEAIISKAHPELVAALKKFVTEHDNIFDEGQMPFGEVYCGDCNTGTGVHKDYCAYHGAKRLL